MFKDYKLEKRVGMVDFITFNKLNGKGEKMQMEVMGCCGTNTANDLPHLWLKEGKTKTLIENYICVETYVTLPNGDCVMKYNPTSKPEIKKDYKGNILLCHNVIDFDWHLEDTAENRQRLINEVAKRFYKEA